MKMNKMQISQSFFFGGALGALCVIFVIAIYPVYQFVSGVKYEVPLFYTLLFLGFYILGLLGFGYWSNGRGKYRIVSVRKNLKKKTSYLIEELIRDGSWVKVHKSKSKKKAIRKKKFLTGELDYSSEKILSTS